MVVSRGGGDKKNFEKKKKKEKLKGKWNMDSQEKMQGTPQPLGT
jgi:hypothetical protein